MPLDALLPLMIWFIRPAGMASGYWQRPLAAALAWAAYVLLLVGIVGGLRLLAENRSRRWTTRSWVHSAVAFGRWQRASLVALLGVHAAMVWFGPLGTELENVTAHWSIGSGGELELFKTLAAAIPAFVGMMGLWWAGHPVSVAARESAALDALEADLPLRIPPTAWAMVAMMARMRLGLALTQWLLLAIVGDGLATLCRLAGRPMDEATRAITLLGSVGAVALLSPLIVRWVLPTRPLPNGPLRHRLESLQSGARVRLGGIFIWNTHGTSANAMVSGFVWPLRYVFLSDHLLETFTDEQIEAVMAHELGHVRGLHMVWFVVLLTGVSMVLQILEPLFNRFGQNPAGSPAAEWVVLLTSGVAVAGGLAVLLAAFIPLSRAFEGQADLDGARLVSGGDVSSEGAARMAGALLRVAHVNGIPPEAGNLTHGSIAMRMARVMRCGGTPDSARNFDRRVLGVKLVIACVWTAGLIATLLRA